MKVLLVGEAAEHRHQLEAALATQLDVVGLPRSAAHGSEFDDQIADEDVVVSLRFERPGGSCPPFKLLHVPGAGLDGIDFASLPRATAVCNVFEHETPIAEYVLLCMLEHAIGASKMRASFTSTSWSRDYRGRVPHGELSGSTVGVIGYGRIGREVARRARAMGTTVIAVDAYAPSDDDVEVREPSELGWLLSAADYVVLCCPLTESTRGLINDRTFGEMKRSGVLINPSRAEIVDESALYYALRDQRIAAAFLDVWYRYPTGDEEEVGPSRFRILDLPNAYCTPHSAAWTTQLPERRYRAIAANIDRLVRGEPLANEVGSSRASK